MTAKATQAPARGSVKRVLVLADLDKQGVREFRQQLMTWLGSRVDKVELEGDLREFLRRREAEGFELAAEKRPDLVVVLGGDGAILAGVRAFAREPVPTLGINFGRVGFLATTPVGDWEEVLTGVLVGHGVLEPRMRLRARMRTHDGDEIEAIALNDVVLSRAVTQGMLTVGLMVDGEWVTDYRADGLIVATPSGSTAHSLSAGGPILIPSMFGLVVTPICPQALAHRPLVLHSESKIELVISSSGGLTTLVVDGQGYAPMRQGDSVFIERHPVAYPLLGWAKLDPYRRLRERLGWSGTVLPVTNEEAAEPRGIAAPRTGPHDDRGL
ncbi:MAG TPA: NAD(+)/NADH kinase [Planctomycetota bacterium]|nr:NAD(+)/NADH kinase [Planctomycetota bacterium]